MDRRAFIGTLVGGLLAAPITAEAQSVGKVYRVGLIFPSPPVSEMTGPEPVNVAARAFVRGADTRASPRPVTSAAGQLSVFDCFSGLLAEDELVGHRGTQKTRSRPSDRVRGSCGGNGRIKPDATGSGAKGAPTREPATDDAQEESTDR